jgi:hypothetical protein
MALTKPARSKILALVQDAKRLLMKEVEEQLQQYYGVRPDGTVLMIDQLTTSDSDFIYTARVLRQRLDYIKTNLPDKNNEDVEAVRQLVREQAFTILNRFASLRMAEERGIIKETVCKEYNSEGFQVFDSITGQGQTASQYMRYKWYIHAIFDELALDLPSVFDRYSPYALIFPSEQAMNRLLDIINREEVTLHREEGFQPVNLWKEDETIGWIYQYYNSREEISAMRDASSAPRNSQELAVRNQFFTPRYVVQFLTDNSLGRIWYEMTEGITVLKSVCPYLIVRPGEVFLQKGESKPESKEENTVYIEFRPIKDPREILMLDPACGSMHFGLYCFDLFEHIYTEAWDNYPELLTDLRNSMTRSDFIKQIPELIIRHNIHGVDIDPRALQIAGLSLWLRAQKSFDKQNLPANQRPQITRSNLVLAEPMPGSIETLSQLVQPLDAPMRKLVLAIWDKMKLAGETGLLLRIEDEIDKTINEIVKELADGKMSTQLSFGADTTELQAAEKAAVYASKQYREHFLNSAEAEVLKMLKQLAESATDGEAYQKLLFADDTARGFAFIELSRKKYDVVLMNPPFGASSINSKSYIDDNYTFSKSDLAAAFIDRMNELICKTGFTGVLSTRTIYFIGSFESWRETLLDSYTMQFADFGRGVLDAQVEASAVIYKLGSTVCSDFLRIYSEKKDTELIDCITNKGKNYFKYDIYSSKNIPNKPFCYWFSNSLLDLFKISNYKNSQGGVKAGLQSGDNNRFIRNHWEINVGNSWKRSLVEAGSTRYYTRIDCCVFWKNNGLEIKNFINSKGELRSVIRNEQYYNNFGISFPKRSSHFRPQIIPEGIIFTNGRFLAVSNSKDDIIVTVAIWNTDLFDYLVKLSVGNIDGVQFENGPIEKFPDLSTSIKKKSRILQLVERQYQVTKFKNSFESNNIDFCDNSFREFDSLKEYNDESINKFKKYQTEYENNQIELNKMIYEELKLSTENIEYFNSLKGNQTFLEDFDEQLILNNLIQTLIGCVFGHWDIRIIKKWKREWSDEDMFKARKHSPFMFGHKDSTFDLILPEYHKEIEKILKELYPIEILKENASSNAVVSKLKEVIMYFWPDSASTIEFELQDHFGVSNLETIFINSNKFFDSHLKDYTRNKRISPIYWPISTASGSYTIWLYYPKMNDQTLFKVVNDYILPKQQEVAEQIKKLENNPDLDNKGKKELQDNQNLFHELKDMEKELLEVAALPYKPNHDDGVLITAAPLYKFFRHSKWKKSTEECWKALQKGEYDWAHLAYSIWPERVTKKCKKDLSMAIAHGLEEICEVKPKEKKEKKAAKPAQQFIQGKLID